MQIFGKFPQIPGLRPVVKLFSVPRKTDSQTFPGPLQRKSFKNYSCRPQTKTLSLSPYLMIFKAFYTMSAFDKLPLIEFRFTQLSL